ncbi:DUF2924 domain-containing protein [Eleftheria terrae]|uniref:DUF2924 domain-containing protein n=1 Tax=Eleftheria terrae TaxID=1597781 RepID=UPI00263B7329|nr:DUF2924 domain-containing protein [Eleftheria terrae]WKB54350.1 DUF2924 domain-containing protein [Eleftheria terrae]WKB55985.1 DUF2924 domain-containing protein [Eleftheria terrae]
MKVGTPARPVAPEPSLAEQIAQLPHLPMTELWARWDRLFDERPPHHNRTYIESRIAYRLQERAFGGLSPSVRRRLEAIGETGIIPRLTQREANSLLPGTLLTRIYDGVEHRVVVRGHSDFEYQGRRYKSLSAIARSITGTQWSGPAFFGLKAARGGSKE